jgi:hypothetical protein
MHFKKHVFRDLKAVWSMTYFPHAFWGAEEVLSVGFGEAEVVLFVGFGRGAEVVLFVGFAGV